MARVLMTLSSEMRETQRSLEASVSNFTNLIQSASTPIFAVDASQKLLVTLWNRRMEIISGIPAEEAVGRSIVDMLTAALDSAGQGERQRRALVRALLRVLDSPLAAERASNAAGSDAQPLSVDSGAQTVHIDLTPGGGALHALTLSMTPIVTDTTVVTGVVCIGETRAPTVGAAVAMSTSQSNVLVGGAGAPTVGQSAVGQSVLQELRPPLAGVVGVLELALRDPAVSSARARARARARRAPRAPRGAALHRRPPTRPARAARQARAPARR